MRKGKSLIDRFKEKYIPEPNSGCWIWIASTSNSGYGKFRINDNIPHSSAHRASWIIHNGPIKKGLNVCHKCDVKLCVNPKHLFLGTTKENVHDMLNKGRHFYKDIKQCKYGHDFSESNTRIRKDGSRACKICAVSYAKMYKSKLKEQK